MASWQRGPNQTPQSHPNAQHPYSNLAHPPPQQQQQQQHPRQHQPYPHQVHLPTLQPHSSPYDPHYASTSSTENVYSAGHPSSSASGFASSSGHYQPMMQSRPFETSMLPTVRTPGGPLSARTSQSSPSSNTEIGSSAASFHSSSGADRPPYKGQQTLVRPSTVSDEALDRSESCDHPHSDQHHPLGPAPLRRGQACQACRRRKLKCDAARPVCNTCTRSRKAAASAKHASPVPDGDCVYDDLPSMLSGESMPSYRRGSLELPRPSKLVHPAVTKASADREEKEIHKVEDVQQGKDTSSKRRRTIAGDDVQTLLVSGEVRNSQAKNETSRSGNPIGGNTSGVREKDRILRLEKRIRQLEGQLEELQAKHPLEAGQYKNGDDSGDEQTTYSSGGPAVPIFSMLSPSSGKEEKYRLQYSQRPARHLHPASVKSHATSSLAEDAKEASLFDFSSASMDANRDERVRSELASGNHARPDLLLQLLWPGWSPDLPSPDTVLAICEIFFRSHPMRSLVYKPSFMSGLLLPPKHPHRPHDALIHAVLAATADISPFYDAMKPSRPARFVMMLSDSRSRVDPQPVADDQLSFKEFHLRKARWKVERSLLTDFRNPLDWIAACLLSCFTLWTDFRVTESYFMGAILVRSTHPAGLDKLRSRHLSPESNTGRAAGLFGAPEGIEEHERRMALWHIFLADQYTGGSPHFYENLMSEASISTHLPCSVADFQAGNDVPPNTQTLASADLFRTGHIDEFTLHIKSAVLVRRACTLHCRYQTTKKKHAGLAIVDKHISEFIDSFPSFQVDQRNHFDVDKLTAWSNISLALFYLHEPYLTPTSISVSEAHLSQSHSVNRIHFAVENVIMTIHRLMNTSFDFALLHPQIFLTWSECGRMLGKDLDYIKRTKKGGPEALQQVMEKLQYIVLALERAGEKNIKARRCSELITYIRAGTLHESILSHLLYTDGVIPNGDEEAGTNYQAMSAALMRSAGSDIPIDLSSLYSGQQSETMDEQAPLSMQTSLAENDVLLNFAF